MIFCVLTLFPHSLCRNAFVRKISNLENFNKIRVYFFSNVSVFWQWLCDSSVMLDWTSLWLCWPFLMVARWLLCVHHYAHILDEKKVPTMWVFCFFYQNFPKSLWKIHFLTCSETPSAARENGKASIHNQVASQKKSGIYLCTYFSAPQGH